MSRPRLQESIQERRLWSLDTTKYDRSPLLTHLEQEALTRWLALWADTQRSSVPKDLELLLVRLLQPLYDILDVLGVQRRSCLATIASVCQAHELRNEVVEELIPHLVGENRAELDTPLLSRVGFFMGPLVEGNHNPSLGEFPCARACVGAGDALGRAEEEEPLLEDVA